MCDPNDQEKEYILEGEKKGWRTYSALLESLDVIGRQYGIGKRD